MNLLIYESIHFLANIDNDPQKEIFLQATELASACGALTTTKLRAQASCPIWKNLTGFQKPMANLRIYPCNLYLLVHTAKEAVYGHTFSPSS